MRVLAQLLSGPWFLLVVMPLGLMVAAALLHLLVQGGLDGTMSVIAAICVGGMVGATTVPAVSTLQGLKTAVGHARFWIVPFPDLLAIWSANALAGGFKIRLAAVAHGFVTLLPVVGLVWPAAMPPGLALLSMVSLFNVLYLASIRHLSRSSLELGCIELIGGIRVFPQELPLRVGCRLFDDSMGTVPVPPRIGALAMAVGTRDAVYTAAMLAMVAGLVANVFALAQSFAGNLGVLDPLFWMAILNGPMGLMALRLLWPLLIARGLWHEDG